MGGTQGKPVPKPQPESPQRDCIKSLLTNDNIFNELDDALKSPVTSLQIACAKNKLSTVRKLIKQGADVNQATEHGCTPAMFACTHDSVDIVTELFEAGVKIDDVSKAMDCQLVHVAASVNAMKVLNWLHSQGVNIDSSDRKNGAGRLLER